MKKVSILILFVVLCVCTSLGSIEKASATSNVSINSKCEVKFLFDGLQAIAFGDPNRVSDGIMDVHHHKPKLEIKQIDQGKQTILYDIADKQLQHKILTVSVPNKEFQPPTRYYSLDMNKDKKDFRWCLDMEEDLFQKQLYLKEEMFFCKIHFLTGEFLTDHVGEEVYQFVAGEKISPIQRPIGMAANHIELKEGDKLTITGLDKDISLPYKAGTVYEVNVTNLPPTDMMNVDHFAAYYDVIKEDVPKYMPVAIKKVAFNPKPIICGAGVFGKSSIK